MLWGVRSGAPVEVRRPEQFVRNCLRHEMPTVVCQMSAGAPPVHESGSLGAVGQIKVVGAHSFKLLNHPGMRLPNSLRHPGIPGAAVPVSIQRHQHENHWPTVVCRNSVKTLQLAGEARARPATRRLAPVHKTKKGTEQPSCDVDA